MCVFLFKYVMFVDKVGYEFCSWCVEDGLWVVGLFDLVVVYDDDIVSKC